MTYRDPPTPVQDSIAMARERLANAKARHAKNKRERPPIPDLWDAARFDAVFAYGPPAPVPERESE